MAESSPRLPPAVGETHFQRSPGHLADEASTCNSVYQKCFLSFLGNNSNTCPLWRTQIAEKSIDLEHFCTWKLLLETSLEVNFFQVIICEEERKEHFKKIEA